MLSLVPGALFIKPLLSEPGPPKVVAISLGEDVEWMFFAGVTVSILWKSEGCSLPNDLINQFVEDDDDRCCYE